MNTHFLIISVLIMVMLISTGCAIDPPLDMRTRPEIQDETLVTGAPCSPPCWHEIVPEETTTEDALKIVTNLPFVDSQSVEETTKDLYLNTDNSILWHYLGTSDFGGNLSIRNDYVIWIEVSYPNFLKLSDVVAVIGEPDFVWVGDAGGAGIDHIFQFFFEESGLLLESRLYSADDKVDGKVLLNPDIEIDEARYFAPQPLEAYWGNIVGATAEQSVQNKEAYQPWPGFGVSIEMGELY